MLNLQNAFTATVVFTCSEGRHPFRLFTKRGWRHCYLIIPQWPEGGNLLSKPNSIVVNSWMDHVRIQHVQKTPQQLAEDAIKEGATAVITFPVVQKFQKRWRLLGVLNCVSLTKSVLSISAWWIYRPDQLAMYLLRHGGKLTKGK